MWEEQKQSLTSPFDCAVCGACVYGNHSDIRTCLPCRSFFRRHAFLPPNTLKCTQNGRCYIEATRRYFTSSLPPCRACRLQKCLAIGMDHNFFRPRSASSPLLTFENRLIFNNILLKTSSLDENVASTTEQLESENETEFNRNTRGFGRPRCSSDVTDRLH